MTPMVASEPRQSGGHVFFWRDCFRCHKSYDGIYGKVFGCRACGHTEPVNVYFDTPFTEDVGVRSLPSVNRLNPRRTGERTAKQHHYAARSPHSSAPPRTFSFYGRRVHG